MPKVYMPEFANNFQCIGRNCENSCCHDWRVDIDQKTYQKYMECDDKILRGKASTSLSLYPDTKSTSKVYATIDLDKKTNRCVFLNDNDLCEWQLKYGVDYLSSTCREYPRRMIRIGNSYLMSLVSSCPEVVRLGLLNKEKMQFATHAKPKLEHSTISSAKDVEQFLFELFHFLVDILQDRRYFFEQRLILLGLFFQKIIQTEYIRPDNTMQAYKEMLRDTSIAEQFASLPEIPAFQFAVLSELLPMIRDGSGIYPDAVNGIGLKEDQTAQEWYQSYFDSLMHYEKSFMQWEHVFENYFVNELFFNIPGILGADVTTQTQDMTILWNFYLQLCVTYRVLKFCFIGFHKLHNPLSNEDIVEIISKTYRTLFSHNQIKAKQMTDWLREKKADSLAYMAVLIRT
ncbi:flagellin lysine-N-methylase [Christensenellaceae bacterium OttesenSCG-928-K19]|nr:flagellin lysine-N-methylase [Christensenellaceae bacterium OttesenSCG-928-K19]